MAVVGTEVLCVVATRFCFQEIGKDVQAQSRSARHHQNLMNCQSESTLCQVALAPPQPIPVRCVSRCPEGLHFKATKNEHVSFFQLDWWFVLLTNIFFNVWSNRNLSSQICIHYIYMENIGNYIYVKRETFTQSGKQFRLWPLVISVIFLAKPPGDPRAKLRLSTSSTCAATQVGGNVTTGDKNMTKNKALGSKRNDKTDRVWFLESWRAWCQMSSLHTFLGGWRDVSICMRHWSEHLFGSQACYFWRSNIFSSYRSNFQTLCMRLWHCSHTWKSTNCQRIHGSAWKQHHLSHQTLKGPQPFWLNITLNKTIQNITTAESSIKSITIILQLLIFSGYIPSHHWPFTTQPVWPPDPLKVDQHGVQSKLICWPVRCKIEPPVFGCRLGTWF